MAQAAQKNRNTTSFVGKLEKLRDDALRIGGFDAYYGKEKDAFGDARITQALDGLRGAQRKNAEATLVAGYNEGFERALEYFDSL